MRNMEAGVSGQNRAMRPAGMKMLAACRSVK
jgi:hypothetical protein